MAISNACECSDFSFCSMVFSFFTVCTADTPRLVLAANSAAFFFLSLIILLKFFRVIRPVFFLPLPDFFPVLFPVFFLICFHFFSVVFSVSPVYLRFSAVQFLFVFQVICFIPCCYLIFVLLIITPLRLFIFFMFFLNKAHSGEFSLHSSRTQLRHSDIFLFLRNSALSDL